MYRLHFKCNISMIELILLKTNMLVIQLSNEKFYIQHNTDCHMYLKMSITKNSKNLYQLILAVENPIFIRLQCNSSSRMCFYTKHISMWWYASVVTDKGQIIKVWKAMIMNKSITKPHSNFLYFPTMTSLILCRVQLNLS